MMLGESVNNMLSPVTADCIFDLTAWVRDYERNCKFPSKPLRAFAIGFYQIHQGIAWKDGGVNKYESYAAATIHLIRCSEQLKLPIEDHLELHLRDFNLRFIDSNNTAIELLCALSGAQQLLFYCDGDNKTERARRRAESSKPKLTQRLAKCIEILVGLIPPEYRVEAFYVATKIMTKELR